MNQPLPGASISLKGADHGTSTDVNGYFKLGNLPTGPATLVVKFLGYQPSEKTVTIGSSNLTLDFSLIPSSENLNKVVIVGYGTQRKADVTGSIATITTKDFVKGQITTPDLAGRKKNNRFCEVWNV